MSETRAVVWRETLTIGKQSRWNHVFAPDILLRL
jgi:hypothetical protein